MPCRVGCRLTALKMRVPASRPRPSRSAAGPPSGAGRRSEPGWRARLSLLLLLKRGGSATLRASAGVWTQLGPWLREPVGRIHWAGTETAGRWMGYVDGAIESGIRAAAEVLRGPLLAQPSLTQKVQTASYSWKEASLLRRQRLSLRTRSGSGLPRQGRGSLSRGCSTLGALWTGSRLGKEQLRVLRGTLLGFPRIAGKRTPGRVIGRAVGPQGSASVRIPALAIS